MILQLKIQSRRERSRMTSHYIGVGSLQGSIFNVFPTHNPQHVGFITFNFIRTNFSARYALHLYDLEETSSLEVKALDYQLKGPGFYPDLSKCIPSVLQCLIL